MKPELMRDWYVVQNGKQIDIHVRDKAEGREITVVSGVRDEDCAKLIAKAPDFEATLEQARAQTWLQAIEFIEEQQRQLWRVDSPEAETVRWLAIAMRRKAQEV